MNSSLLFTKWGRFVAKSLLKPIQKKKPEVETKRWKIVRGDMVKVIQGPLAGQQGKIAAVIRDKNRVIVEGVNMKRRIVKSKMNGNPGQIVLKPCSIHYSNVMLLDPTTNLPTKIARRFLEDGTKVRVSKKTGHLIPKPDPFVNRPPRPIIMGVKDTLPASVFATTFADYDKYLPFIYAPKK